MSVSPVNSFEVRSALDDLAYQQARVLLLVSAVSTRAGHQRKLDGLTKLAKLDFLVRYPGVAGLILDDLDTRDPRMGLSPEEVAMPTAVADPMIRYKYGPWDDRYYVVIGGLVGRGLLRYAKGRRGNVALAVAEPGRKLVRELRAQPEWSQIAGRCDAIAQASEGLTGAALKDLIYSRLPQLMDRPHRERIV